MGRPDAHRRDELCILWPDGGLTAGKGEVDPTGQEPNDLGNGGPHGTDETTHANGTSGEDDRWLRSVVENSSEVVKVVDTDGTLRYASPAFGRVFGYDPDQVVGTMNVLNLVHPDDLPHSGEVSQCERAYGKIDGGTWRRDGF